MLHLYLRKGVAFAVVLLFTGMVIIPSTGTTDVKKSTMPTLNGNTLYVGGSGPGNYTKIQDAIDNASDGDTVFVYDDSSPYYENVDVWHSINLIGENKNTTIIDVSNIHFVNTVYIHAPNCRISGFTLTGANGGTVRAGVKIPTNNNIIQECKMINSEGSGILLYGNNNWIDNNIIAENDGYGIYLGSDSHQTMNNTISNNSIVFNRLDGIAIWGYYHNGSEIYHNDILKNKRLNARDRSNNIWDNGYPSGGNYWDDYNGTDSNGDGIGDTPYHIYGGNNSDRYPLMNPLKEYEPIAYFTYIIDNFTVIFNASLSFDPDGMVTNWLWDFGDGVEGAGVQAPHTYKKNGIYNVTLTVFDNEGKEDNIIITIVVQGFAPSFIVGRLDNLTTQGKQISFEAVKIIAISSFPFNYYFLTSKEEIRILKDYLGLVGARYIFAFCKAIL